MKNMFLIGTSALLLSACVGSSTKKPIEKLPLEQTSVFASTDKNLENAYNWAKKMALSYVHDGSDPVGYWYEAALPQREAFCMRDVSHQSVGAQILGLAEHNKNMFGKFAKNISESKDWCTYWEINRYDKPAPADYANDKEFWYNLNANFDVIQACWKMYEWTGDKDYLTDSCFVNFYDKSLNEYVKHWRLGPENIMDRPRYMHQPDNFDLNNNFHTCRGLASYVENFRGLTLGVDLLASMYAGYKAHAQMAAICGDSVTARNDLKKADAYQNIIEDKWWDEEHQYYQTFWTEDKTFHRGEGVPVLLWFNAIKDDFRLKASINDILSKEWNVENLSHFPEMLYRFGYDEEAYKYLVTLPSVNRCEYPEVSYGVIEGCIGGLMGINPSSSNNTITTCSHLTDNGVEVEVKNVPVFNGYITVKHIGNKITVFENNTGRDIVWNASFIGNCQSINAGGKVYKTTVKKLNDNHVSSACINLKNGESLTAGV